MRNGLEGKPDRNVPERRSQKLRAASQPRWAGPGSRSTFRAGGPVPAEESTMSPPAAKVGTRCEAPALVSGVHRRFVLDPLAGLRGRVPVFDTVQSLLSRFGVLRP